MEDSCSSASRKRSPPACKGDKDESPKKKKLKVTSRKKRPGFDDEIFSETTYFIKNGLRYVKPYYFTFTTHAKGRWLGSTIYDVFCREFQAESPQYYERAIKAGKVTVNGNPATMDTLLVNNDLVCHKVHRHEPPVTANPLTVIHEDDDIIVVDKPTSIPVHPCGRYRHNSVVFLLGKEHNVRNVHTIHRLDRLTSGLLMFAKSVSKAQQMELQMRERRVKKLYVCRVQGEFPSESVECNEPILVVSHKLGVSKVDPSGKPCSTCFTRLSYNGTTSVVKCTPKTGRMHQIRVHLQWLGYPIVNDPLYNHPAWKNKSHDHHDVSTVDHVISEIVKTDYSGELLGGTVSLSSSNESTSTPTKLDPPQMYEIVEDTIPALSKSLQDNIEDETSTAVAHIDISPNKGPSSDSLANGVQTAHCVSEDTCSNTVRTHSHSNSDVEKGQRGNVDPDCTECQLVRADPTPSQLVMYLHALSYEGEGWSFSAAMPPWADSQWRDD